MTNKVEICGVNTSKLPVLSREEKNKLFIKIKNGDLHSDLNRNYLSPLSVLYIRFVSSRMYRTDKGDR